MESSSDLRRTSWLTSREREWRRWKGINGGSKRICNKALNKVSWRCQRENLRVCSEEVSQSGTVVDAQQFWRKFSKRSLWMWSSVRDLKIYWSRMTEVFLGTILKTQMRNLWVKPSIRYMGKVVLLRGHWQCHSKGFSERILGLSKKMSSELFWGKTALVLGVFLEVLEDLREAVRVSSGGNYLGKVS